MDIAPAFKIHLAVEGLCDLGDSVCDLVGLVTGFYQPQGGLARQVSGHHGIGFATSYLKNEKTMKWDLFSSFI